MRVLSATAGLPVGLAVFFRRGWPLRTVAPRRVQRATAPLEHSGVHQAAPTGDGGSLDGLPVAEEFVVLVVAPVPAADLRVVGHELDALDPLDLFEAELDLVAKP